MGFFTPAFGGEDLYLSDSYHRFIVPKRIKTLYDHFMKHQPLAFDRNGLLQAIAAFNLGHATPSWGISGSRTPMMTRLADLMSQMSTQLNADSSDDDPNNHDNDSRIITIIHTWFEQLFTGLLTEDNNKSDITATARAQNNGSLRQLRNMHLSTRPLKLTFISIKNTRSLFDAIALAMALKFNITSMTLTDCDIEQSDIELFTSILKNYHLLKAFTSDNSMSNDAFNDLVHALNGIGINKNLKVLRIHRAVGYKSTFLYVPPVFNATNYTVLDLADNKLGSYSGHFKFYHSGYLNYVMDITLRGKIIEVNFSNCEIRERDTFNIILTALSPNCSVVRLNLSGNSLIGYPTYWQQLIEQLDATWQTQSLKKSAGRQKVSRLRGLNLADIPFSEPLVLAKLLEVTTQKPYGQLRKLNLSNCHITASMIAMLITTLTTTNEPAIPVSSSSSTSAPLLSASQSKATPSSLRNLVLAKNPLSDQGARDLINAIIDGRLPITELDLSECNLSEAFGSFLLTDLQKQSARLQKQRIAVAEIDGEIIYEIPQLPLKVLHLSGNPIAPRTLQQIQAIIGGEPWANTPSPSSNRYALHGTSGLPAPVPTIGPQAWQDECFQP